MTANTQPTNLVLLAGPYDLLVPIGWVQYVDVDCGSSGPYATWNGQIYPTVDLLSVLGTTGSIGAAVYMQLNAVRAALLVSGLRGLQTVAPADVHPLPYLSPGLSNLAESIVYDRQRARGLLVLRAEPIIRAAGRVIA